MNASLLSLRSPSTTAGSMHGQRPARNADAGQLGQDFQRLLRDRIDARREQDPGEQDPGLDARTASQSVFGGGRRGRHGRQGGDDVGDGAGPDATGNDALHRPELPGSRAAACDAIGSSPRTSAPAPDPRDVNATRAALEAAVTTPVPTPESRAAATWEVSLPQASGGALQLHASRAQPAGGAAAWTLDIRSGARDLTSTLVRTTSRLSDRLEARAVPAHIRIERDDEENEQ